MTPSSRDGCHYQIHWVPINNAVSIPGRVTLLGVVDDDGYDDVDDVDDDGPDDNGYDDNDVEAYYDCGSSQ